VRILQRWLQAAFRSVGYELTAARHLPRVSLAAHLRALFERYTVQSVFDVGANEGQYRDFLRRDVGFQGQIVSFEPIPAMYDRLCVRARGDARWRVYPYALGEREEQRELHVTNLSAFSSFLPPGGGGTALFGSEMAVTGHESVQMRALDSLVEELAEFLARGRAFLKLDTQGYDLEVIRGASRVLAGVAALQTELSFIPIYQGMPSYEQMLRELTARGFEVSGLFPVNLDSRLRMIEADCVLVNALASAAPITG
jgi:FkbM family methyltransferase